MIQSDGKKACHWDGSKDMIIQASKVKEAELIWEIIGTAKLRGTTRKNGLFRG